MRNTGRSDRFLSGATALLISTYFLLLTRDSFRAFFSLDDLMNLYRAWVVPAGMLVKGNLLFFRVFPFYRPLASVWYRVIFHFAGFDPLPFHVIYIIGFLLNLLLTYAVAVRLTGSREVSAVTALLISYHHRMNFLFVDTGFVYDALCYTFYFASFLLYLRARQQKKRLISAIELAGCCVLFICALNSKEMAVTLPAVLLLYELVFHRVSRWTARRLAQWLICEGRGVLVLGVVALVFVAGMMTDPNSLALKDEAYKPVFTAAQFMQTSRHFLGDVFSEDHTWPAWAVLTLWSALLAFAWLARSRVVWFAWFFLMITPLPVAFIHSRTPAQYYIPWFGWMLYAAVLLVRLLTYLTRRIPADPLRLAGIRIVGLTVLLFAFYEHKGWANATSVTVEAPIVRSATEQLHRLYPRLRPGSRLYFMDDPFAPEPYDLVFLIRLSYEDSTLVVDRAKHDGHVATAELASYNHVFDYRAGQFYELHAPWVPPELPMIVHSPDGPEVYHQGFVRVTTKFPAAVGEPLITKVINLGKTDPPVAEGRPFPQEPLLPVTSPVEVRVNGLKAEVVTKIGWPELIDTYRLDFRIPPGVKRGKATVEVGINGVKGPPATISVR